MAYNEKELQAKLQEEKQQNIVLPTKKDTVGSLLREKREELNLSIEKISSELCIKPQYLIALENDSFSLLPGSAYVIGFIKSYASYLKLDAAQIISLYKQESSNMPHESQDLIEDENSLIRDPVINSNHIIIGSLVVFLGVVFVYMANNKTSSEKPVETVVASQLEPEQDNLEISVEDNISTKSEDSVVENNSPVVELSEKPLPDYFETNIDSVTMEQSTPVAQPDVAPSAAPATEVVSATVTPETEEETQSEVVAEALPSSGDVHEYGLANKASSRIAVRATKRVWVKLKKDGFYKYDKDNGDIGTGSTVFETILEPGDTYYVPNDAELYMTIGNAQGVSILVDGREIAPLSTKDVSRHNVEMNAEKLLNNTAYVRNRKVD